MAQNQPHILLVTFPAQGHLNPSLQFAKRLLRLGVKVTFTTTLSAYRRMTKAAPNNTTPPNFNFNIFSDGFDDGYKTDFKEPDQFLSQLKNRGSESVKETIVSGAKQGSPVTFLVYSLLLPWAAEVARDLHVPSTLLWSQPASVFDVYYYYFHGYDKLIAQGFDKPSWSIEIPGLPLLKTHDLPSFCLPSNTHSFAMPLFKQQLDILEAEENPKLLVNTFDSLEVDALRAVDKIKMIAVGPLIPSAFLDGKDPTDKSFGGDLFETSKDGYMEWMNTRADGSVIYISFGSLLVQSKKQKEAMASSLLKLKMPFLWVVRDKKDEISCIKELEELGMIVEWCSQLEVLSHPCLGCFVTHCGWNSTLESIVCGVPVVAFPQWTDQGTNAKLIEDVWETGVRVIGDEGVVESEEIKRCIEMVMGGVKMRQNAKKWRELGREAMEEGGSSDINLKAFVEDVVQHQIQKRQFE